MKTRLNNYSPLTGNRYNHCRVTLGPKEMNVLRKHGLDEGSCISISGTIDGSKVILIIQEDEAGEPIRAGNRGENIYWFTIDRNRIDLVDEGRPLSEKDDIYISPLDAIRSDGNVMLVSSPDTVRKANRKRRTQADANESDDFDNVEVDGDESPINMHEAKRRLAKFYDVDPENVKITITG